MSKRISGLNHFGPVRLSERALPAEAITPEPVFQARRDFMRGSISRAAGLALAGGFSLADAATLPSAAAENIGAVKAGSYSTLAAQTSYKRATHYNNFFEFGEDKTDPSWAAQDLTTDPWSVTVEGECAKPATVSFADLMAPHELEERVYRLRCVEAWSMVIPWIGVPLADILQRFEPTVNAKYVAFETLYRPGEMIATRSPALQWPYREGLRMDEAMHPLAFIAVGMYGKTLPKQNGAPLRLVVPWKYGFKSIKSIVRIRFTEQQPVSSWNQSEPGEYGFYANVNPAVDHPRWDQSRERRIGEWFKRETLPFNGYADQVASLYKGMDLKKHF